MRSRFKLFTAALTAVLLSTAALAADQKSDDPFAEVRSGAAAGADQAAVTSLPDPPVFDAQAWVLMDYHSGRVICAHNPQVRIWPASLTKMMTSYVIGTEIKAGRLHMSDDVVIPENAWAKNYTDSSKMFIEVGKAIKVGDLVRGIIIQSGNDACVAMAMHLAGSEAGFVSVMNKYAAKLGLTQTHFANVHGLFDEQNYSTAYDMALMGRILIRDLPEEYPLYSQKEFTFNGIKQLNRNRLLWDTSISVDGIKTGHLSEVGYNLVASGTQDGMRLIAAVIGSKSDKNRAQECKSLLTYGFRNFELYSPLKAGKPLLTRTVRMGEESSVGLELKEDLSLLVPRGTANQTRLTYRLKQKVFVAPLTKGQELGVIDVVMGDKVIASAPLLASADIPEGGFFTRLWDRIMLFFTGSDEEETVAAPAQPG